MTVPKIVVTGGAGFVGLHLTKLLRQRFPASSSVISTSKTSCMGPDGIEFEALDVSDKHFVEDRIRAIQPSHVIHLAGFASVADAQNNSEATWNLNVYATLNIANAILKHAPECVLIFAGSGEVYGSTAKSVAILGEDSLLAPANEYGATKAAADLSLGALAHHGLKLIRFRPFNHTGPGQSDQFVIPAFAQQIARIEAGLQPPTMNVGNLAAQRDFLDVRDVAAAYVLAVERSQEIPNGTIMNLASGIPRRIGDMLEYLTSLSTAKINIQLDPARQRPSEIACYVGNADRARSLLGWEPRYPISSTLSDVLDFSRDNLALRENGI